MAAEIHAVAPTPELEADEVFDAPDDSVIRLKTKPQGREKRVILFYIDDRPYTVPAHPGAELSLQALDVTRTQGQEVGIAFMLRQMLGDEGYVALMNYRGLAPEDLGKVIKKASDILNGALEAPKDGSRRG